MQQNYKNKRTKVLSSLNSRKLSSQEYYGHDPSLVKKIDSSYKNRLIAANNLNKSMSQLRSSPARNEPKIKV